MHIVKSIEYPLLAEQNLDNALLHLLKRMIISDWLIPSHDV